MRKIFFTKMVASGNDFVVIEGGHKPQVSCLPAGRASYRLLAQKICDRKFGVGADGLLVLEKSKIADVRMRIFNADGSEAEMCGNGARCTALYYAYSMHRKPKTHDPRRTTPEHISIETKAGFIHARVNSNVIKVQLTNPQHIKLDIPIKFDGRVIKVNFINTGVPHAVIFVEGIDKIKINEVARFIRNHKIFHPAGTNVDFVEVLGKNHIKLRTYERGVEDETLACGTGTVASSLIFALKSGAENKISALTKSGELLKVYFSEVNHKFANVWLEGKANVVFNGQLLKGE